MRREFDLGRDLDEMAMSMRRKSLKEDIVGVVVKLLSPKGKQKEWIDRAAPQPERIDGEVT